MALFDLHCNECNEEFTKMVAYAKLPEAACPKCGSTDHRRVYKATIKGPITSSGSKSSSYYSPPVRGFT